MAGLAFKISLKISDRYEFPAPSDLTYNLLPEAQAPAFVPIIQALEIPTKLVFWPPPGVKVLPDHPAPALLLFTPPDGASKSSLQNVV